MDTMHVDNKKSGNDVKYILLKNIGQCKNENRDFLLTVNRKIVQVVVERFIDHY